MLHCQRVSNGIALPSSCLIPAPLLQPQPPRSPPLPVLAGCRGSIGKAALEALASRDAEGVLLHCLPSPESGLVGCSGKSSCLCQSWPDNSPGLLSAELQPPDAEDDAGLPIR